LQKQTLCFLTFRQKKTIASMNGEIGPRYFCKIRIFD